jgi:hypothetical protein
MSLHGTHIAAKTWLLTRNPASTLPFGVPSVETHSSGADRGLGLFAARQIARHSVIIADKAMILMKPADDLQELYAQYLDLPADQQERYLTLGSAANEARDTLLAQKLRSREFHKIHGDDGVVHMMRVASIMQTNAFNVDTGDGQGARHRALFPLLARANHSCMPNAHVCYYPSGHDPEGDKKGRMFVHALRTLDAGEEILISYFDILLPRDERQSRMSKWGFQCHCPVCDEDPTESDGLSLEAQRKFIREWLSLQAQALRSPQLTIAQLKSVIDMGTILISNAEINASLTPAFPNMFEGLAMLQAKAIKMDGRQSNAECISFLESAAAREANITGVDSGATDKRLKKLLQYGQQFGKVGTPRLVKSDQGFYETTWETS